jgi:hypothetical protein
LSQNQLPAANGTTQAQRIKIAAPRDGLSHAIKLGNPSNMTSLTRQLLLISIGPETVAQSQSFGMYLFE